MDLGDMLSNVPLTDVPLPLVDDSGLPCPTRATVTLNSGIQFDAHIKYGGKLGRERKYKVIAEVDWATAGVARIDVDRWPPDVYIILSIPDEWTDEQATTFGHAIEWEEAGRGYRPRKMQRENI